MSEVCFDCALLPTVVTVVPIVPVCSSVFSGVFSRSPSPIIPGRGFSQRTKELVKELAEELGARALGNPGKPGAGIVVTVVTVVTLKSAGLHRPDPWISVENHRTPTRNPTVIGHKSCYSSFSLRHNFDHVWLCCSCAPKDLLFFFG